MQKNSEKIKFFGFRVFSSLDSSFLSRQKAKYEVIEPI